MPYRQCHEHAMRDVRRDGDDELPVRTKTRAWRSRWVTGGACARRRPPANRRGVRPPKGANIVRSSLPLPLPHLTEEDMPGIQRCFFQTLDYLQQTHPRVLEQIWPPPG